MFDPRYRRRSPIRARTPFATEASPLDAMIRQQSLQPAPGKFFRWLVASYLAACALIFGLLHVGLAPIVLFTIPLGALIGYAGAWLRQRLTPERYTFAVVPTPQRTRIMLVFFALFLSTAVVHIANGDLMGVWSAVAMGGTVLLLIAGDFGHFASATRSEDDGEPPHALEPAAGPAPDGTSSPPAQ